MGISFRHSAGFGKRMEYYLIGQMLMEGLDCYVPLVDDHGVDCVIKKEDGTFIEVQIKARSCEVTDGDAALFAEITDSTYMYLICNGKETMFHIDVMNNPKEFHTFGKTIKKVSIRGRLMMALVKKNRQ